MRFGLVLEIRQILLELLILFEMVIQTFFDSLYDIFLLKEVILWRAGSHGDL